MLPWSICSSKKGNRASEIVNGYSVPVSVQKPSAYFRQRHTVQQMEVYAVCHFTSNQVQQCVHVWLLLSIWYCPSTSVTVLHRWCGFLWLVCCFSGYVCLYGGSMCAHKCATTVHRLLLLPAAAKEREGEKDRLTD